MRPPWQRSAGEAADDDRRQGSQKGRYAEGGIVGLKRGKSAEGSLPGPAGEEAARQSWQKQRTLPTVVQLPSNSHNWDLSELPLLSHVVTCFI